MDMLSLGTIEYGVFHSDGSIKNLPGGYYWRMLIGPGHYGEHNGPYPTEDAAKAAAVERFEETKRKVLS
jgi:hypothetical protein